MLKLIANLLPYRLAWMLGLDHLISGFRWFTQLAPKMAFDTTWDLPRLAWRQLLEQSEIVIPVTFTFDGSFQCAFNAFYNELPQVMQEQNALIWHSPQRGWCKVQLLHLKWRVGQA